jgi:hypothetical protein
MNRRLFVQLVGVGVASTACASKFIQPTYLDRKLVFMKLKNVYHRVVEPKANFHPLVTFRDMGADQIDMMKYMLYVEGEFECEIDDAGFVPRANSTTPEWRDRRVHDLVVFCSKTLTPPSARV